MLKKYFVFDKEYFKALAAVALPLALQNVINNGVSAMDTIMLGELGDIAVSGASLGGQTFFLMMIACFGVCAVVLRCLLRSTGAKVMWMLSAVLCESPPLQCF